MKHPALAAASALLALAAVSARADAPGGNPALAPGVDWVASNQPLLNRAMTAQRVAALVEKSWAAGAEDRAVVADFRFADLDRNGRLQLIVCGDVAGRGHGGLIATVYVLDNPGGDKPRLLQEIDVGPPGLDGSLNGILRDLDHDGVPELILPQYLQGGFGWHPASSVPHVYRWNGRRFVKADAQFKSYYRNEALPALKQKLASLQKEHSGAESGMSPADRQDPDEQFAEQRYQEELSALRQSIEAVRRVIRRR